MTTSPHSSVHHTLMAQTSRTGQVMDSLPRTARVHVRVNVTGVGETRLYGHKHVQFGALMLEEPAFTFGIVARHSIGNGSMPYASAVVLGWHKNSNGLYTGADVGFKVMSANPKIALAFSLTFEGQTLRAATGHDGSLGQESTSPNHFTGGI